MKKMICVMAVAAMAMMSLVGCGKETKGKVTG